MVSPSKAEEMQITARQLLKLWTFFIQDRHVGNNMTYHTEKENLYDEILKQQSDEVVDTEKPENAKMRFIAGEKKKDE